MANDLPEGWAPIKEAAARYGLTYHQLYKWYERGLVHGRRVPPHDVLIDLASLQDWLPPPGWAWLKDARRPYHVAPYTVLQLVQEGRVRARKRGAQWQVQVASLEQALEEREIPASWITTEEAGRRLGVTAQEIRRRIRAGQLRARRHGRRQLVEETSLEEVAVPPGWMTAREMAEKASVGINTVREWIHKGQVRARKVHGRWIVEAGNVASAAPPPGWSWLSAVRGTYPLSCTTAYRLVRKGTVKARKAGRRWQVEVASLKAALETLRPARAAVGTPRAAREEEVIPPDWITVTVKEAARRLQRSVWAVRRRIRPGRLRAYRRGHRWLIEESGLEVPEIPPGWITLREASQRSGLAVRTLRKRIGAGKLAERKVGGRVVVEEHSVEGVRPPASA
jgi:excisionase family DNA binding protein